MTIYPAGEWSLRRVGYEYALRCGVCGRREEGTAPGSLPEYAQRIGAWRRVENPLRDKAVSLGVSRDYYVVCGDDCLNKIAREWAASA